MTVALLVAVSVAAAAASTPVATPSPSPSYTVTIAATGITNDGVPLVTGIVNQRVPSAPVRLSVRVEPGAPADTVVRWSSPDGKNELGADFFIVGHSDLTWDNTLGDSTIGVFERDGASGEATIVADVGPPVNARATISVLDGVGIGFGCYGFMPQGPSVRFEDGVPKRSTLSDADVAVVGPAILATEQDGSKVPLGPGPWYGCWGENVDPSAHEYGLRFKYGGKIDGGTFSRYLPYEAVATAGVLDVRSAAGTTYRLHVHGGAGTYFTGWVEPLRAAKP